MSISKSRKLEILDLIVERLVAHIPSHSIVEVLAGSSAGQWVDVLGDIPETSVLYELVGDVIPDTEMDDLLKPYLAERLKDDLGAKSVTIEW